MTETVTLPADALRALVVAAGEAREAMATIRMYADQDHILRGTPPPLRAQVTAFLYGACCDIDAALELVRPALLTAAPGRRARLPGTGPGEVAA